MATLPVYRGSFGTAQAERLLWRAGFGPRPGEAPRLAKRGLRAAVRSLTRPGPERLVGPAPRDGQGNPIAPFDVVGHDHLWWLDRMVRSTAPLVERMALVWHDWFATQRVGGITQERMIDQNQLFRRHALGSFAQLLEDVTKDPAMLRWLNGDKNTVRSPNENYARELMELFTLGVNRGYTEQDIREQSRALTGWRSTRRRATRNGADGSRPERAGPRRPRSEVARCPDADEADALCRGQARAGHAQVGARGSGAGGSTAARAVAGGADELMPHRALGMRATLTVTR